MSDSCDPMDCSPPGSSVHSIFQARILEWVAISFSRGSSQPRDQTQVSCRAGRFFTDWATTENLMEDMKGLVSLKEEIQRCSFSLSCENTRRKQPPINQEQSLYQQADHAHTFIWGSQPPELWEINVCCWRHLVCGILLQQSKLRRQKGNASWKDLESEKYLNGKSAERTMRREGRNQILIKWTGSMLGVMDQITVLLREEPTFPSVSPFFICIYLGGFLW